MCNLQMIKTTNNTMFLMTEHDSYKVRDGCSKLLYVKVAIISYAIIINVFQRKHLVKFHHKTVKSCVLSIFSAPVSVEETVQSSLPFLKNGCSDL